MFRAKIYLCLYFCVTNLQFGISVTSEEQKRFVETDLSSYITVNPLIEEQNSSTNTRVNNHFVNVDIKFPTASRATNKNQNIYTYYASTAKIEGSDKVNMFYICMGCCIGRWVKYEIYDLIKSTSLFARLKLGANNTTVDCAVEKNVSDIDWNRNDLVSYVDKSIYALSTLLDVKPHTISSNETDVLHALYEFKLKIQYFKSLCKDDGKTADEKNYIVLRECLKIIIKVQKYLLRNCQTEDYVLDENVLADETKLDGARLELVEKTYVDEYLAKDFAWNSDYASLKSCSVDEIVSMFNKTDNAQGTENGYDYKYSMEENVKLHTFKTKKFSNSFPRDRLKDIVLDTVNSAKITWGRKMKGITFNELREKVKISYDIEVVYFYLNSLLNAIISIVQTKIELVALNDGFSADLMNYIKKIQMEIKNLKVFPEQLTDYFDYLVKSQNISESRLKESMSNIFPRIRHFITFPDWVTSKCTLEELKEFMDALLNRKRDFECFNELITFLRDEYNMHYLPFIADTSVRNYVRPSFNNYIKIDKDTHNDACDYINSMYTLVLDMTDTLNDIQEPQSGDSEKKYFQQLKHQFETVKNYFHMTISSKIKDYNVLRIVYDSIIVMVNMKFENYSSFDKNNIERFVYLIMTEMNGFRVNYCHHDSWRSDFFMHKNARVLEILNSSPGRKGKKTTVFAINNLLLQSIHDKRKVISYSHFDVDHLYNNYVKTILLYNKYKHIILYCWKGEVKNVEDIYQHIASRTVLNSRFLYAFYDYIFKFFLAAFFHELRSFIISEQNNTALFYPKWQIRVNVNKRNSYEKAVDSLSTENFPAALRPIVFKLKNLATKPAFGNKCVIENKILMAAQLEKLFNENYIVFKTPKESAFDKKCSFTETPLDRLGKMLINVTAELPKLKELYLDYSRVHRFNENEFRMDKHLLSV